MTTYVSQDKLEELKEEFVFRQKQGRKDIASKIEQAKELGDLSENFEYHEAKEQQAQNEARILELKDMVQNAVIVEEQSGGESIKLGTKFKAEIGFELVGSSEADPVQGKISNETPVGNAFLGKKVGEVVEIELPNGPVQYQVTEIT